MSRPPRYSRRRFLQITGAALPASALAAQAPGRLKTHKYEELMPEDFYAELERAPIAYWGCGAMEEHGLQNALGVDPTTAYEICLRAVKISGGIVFPLVPFAPAYVPGLSRRELRDKSKELFLPSLWTSGELCKQLYIELLESLADIGFKSCIAFSGHAPGDALLQQIDKELSGKVGGMRFWGGGTVSILRDHLRELAKQYPLGMGHGMMWETSIMMALNPDWVDVSRAKRVKNYSRPSQLSKQPDKNLDDIANANAELGNREINLAAERAAKIAREMLQS
jgi:creatinine amidohydrolase/Fe(II)-dependent formamide hydrolase-like protein